MCEVQTFIDMTYLDYELQENHFSLYEKGIRFTPEHSCICCNKFSGDIDALHQIFLVMYIYTYIQNEYNGFRNCNEE